MKKLNKAQNTELQEWITKLGDAKQKMEDAYGELEEKHGILADAIGEYNGIVTDIGGWRDQLVGEMEDYQSERSDKWQEGDAGQQYESWIDEWRGLEFEEIEVPDLPEAPEVDHVELLDNVVTDSAEM